MSGFVGADIAQLVALRTRFELHAKKIAEIASTSTTALTVAEWAGADIDRVRGEWRSNSHPALLRLVEFLNSAATDLARQADQQREASRDDSRGMGRSAGGAGAAISGHTTMADRWDTVRNGTGDDGIRIDEVVGPDGTARYVLYVDGTEPSRLFGNRSLYDNVGLFGTMTVTYAQILNAMRANVPDGSEVMIYGYSQGGIHAQELAESGAYKVTDVVTFGSPYRNDDDTPGGTNYVRIHDEGERWIPYSGKPNEIRDSAEEFVDHVVTAWRSILGDDAGAVTHEVARLNRGLDINYTSRASDVDNDLFIGTHGDQSTYRQGASEWEAEASQSAEGQRAIASQARFDGVAHQLY
ncbi:MAG: hypothetical protein ABI435_00440 [Pseudolysinimonas sp.]